MSTMEIDRTMIEQGSVNGARYDELQAQVVATMGSRVVAGSTLPVRMNDDAYPSGGQTAARPGESFVVLGPEDEELPQFWQAEALCAQTDPDAFFPEKGGSTSEAKRVCGRCDVRGECLSFALAHDEKFGIWGGLSERERRSLKRRS